MRPPDHPGDALRPPLLQGTQGEPEHVFAGQRVGVTQVGERIWLVIFMHYDLGYFDDKTWPAGTDRESLPTEAVRLPIRSE